LNEEPRPPETGRMEILKESGSAGIILYPDFTSLPFL